MSHGHYCIYPNPSEDRYALSCIHFDCVECTEQFDKSWLNR